MDLAEQGAMSPAFPHTADWIGFVGGLFPFLFSHREGNVDWVAIAGGTAALVAALFGLAVLKRTPREMRSKRIVATVLLFMLGVLQFGLRGFGLL